MRALPLDDLHVSDLPPGPSSSRGGKAGRSEGTAFSLRPIVLTSKFQVTYGKYVCTTVWKTPGGAVHELPGGPLVCRPQEPLSGSGSPLCSCSCLCSPFSFFSSKGGLDKWDIQLR